MVLVSAGISAVGCLFLLAEYIHAAGVVYAANTSIYADELVSTVATIDGREVVVTESLIRAQLQLDDANGIFDMQIDDILEGMGVIGYPTGTEGHGLQSVPGETGLGTNETASSPTPPAQTVTFEVPFVFGPAPRLAGYVDPDTIDPIIFGPHPCPYDFVDLALEEPVIFGPSPRPDNYIEAED
ncbi:hypothetical protein Tco_1545083, partial [Tanacetum coccineum]